MMSDETKRRPETELTTKDSKKQRNCCKEHQVNSPKDVHKLLNELKHADPVLRLHLANGDSPDISPTAKDLLESLLYPLSSIDFKSTCFRKKAVNIRSNRKDRARDIITNYMFGLDSKQIFEETSSDSIFLWIPSNDKEGSSCSNTNEKKSLQSIDIQDPNTAHILHTHSNYASYCRAPPELEQPLVSSMLRCIGLGLGQYDPSGKLDSLASLANAYPYYYKSNLTRLTITSVNRVGEKLTTLGRGEVETFIGTTGHVTDWHTDFQVRKK